MSNNDELESSGPLRGRRGAFILAAVVGGLALAAMLVILNRHDVDSSAPNSASAQPSSSLAATTTSLSEEDAVVSRLRVILEQRDRAYQERNIDLLRKVYSADCPCLRGDGDAIRQLLKDDALWIGASTSVRVKKTEKTNDRIWIVVADFIASPFKIETESGELIRAVEGRTELFRFVLSRPAHDEELSLGYAAPVDEG